MKIVLCEVSNATLAFRKYCICKLTLAKIKLIRRYVTHQLCSNFRPKQEPPVEGYVTYIMTIVLKH